MLNARMKEIPIVKLKDKVQDIILWPESVAKVQSNFSLLFEHH